MSASPHSALSRPTSVYRVVARVLMPRRADQCQNVHCGLAPRGAVARRVWDHGFQRSMRARDQHVISSCTWVLRAHTTAAAPKSPSNSPHHTHTSRITRGARVVPRYKRPRGHTRLASSRCFSHSLSRSQNWHRLRKENGSRNSKFHLLSPLPCSPPNSPPVPRPFPAPPYCHPPPRFTSARSYNPTIDSCPRLRFEIDSEYMYSR